MTRSESTELFIYDLAVEHSHQRKGIGRAPVTWLRDAGRAAGHGDVFVPAEDEDTHALDFYRAVGGVGTLVTVFTFEVETVRLALSRDRALAPPMPALPPRER